MKRNGSYNKAIRLILLMEMQKKGELEGLSYQKIGNLFSPPVIRSTIMHDLRDVEELKSALKEMAAKNAS